MSSSGVGGVVWKDVVGEVRPEDAARLLGWWFEPGDQVVITGLRRDGVAGGRVTNACVERDVLVDRLTGEVGRTFLSSVCSGRDVYFTLAEASGRDGGISSRLRKSEVGGVIGLYADLDVKEGGGFKSESEVRSFIGWVDSRLPVGCVVMTGTGGAHLYWKLAERVDVGVGEALQVRLWEWLNWASGGRVDRLVDVVRMLRLPGTLRSDGSVVSVLDGGVGTWGVVEADEVRRVTGVCGGSGIGEGSGVGGSGGGSGSGGVGGSGSGRGGAGSVAALAAGMVVEERLGWADILEPLGWVRLWSGAWQRPGGRGKSAAEFGEGLLSVFSSAVETGLGVGVWGKWEALVRLYFAGAEDSAVAWVRENLL